MKELQVWVLIHKRPMVQPLFQGFFVQVNTVCYMLSKDYQWGPAEAIYCFQLFYVLVNKCISIIRGRTIQDAQNNLLPSVLANKKLFKL